MNNLKPIWPYVVIVICGLVLFAGSVGSLVVTVRASGSSQYYYAFNTVILIMLLTLLVGAFAFARRND